MTRHCWSFSTQVDEDLSKYIKNNYTKFEDIFTNYLRLGNPVKNNIIQYLIDQNVTKVVKYGMSSPMIRKLQKSQELENEKISNYIKSYCDIFLVQDLLESQSEFLKIWKIPHENIEEI